MIRLPKVAYDMVLSGKSIKQNFEVVKDYLGQKFTFHVGFRPAQGASCYSQ